MTRRDGTAEVLLEEGDAVIDHANSQWIRSWLVSTVSPWTENRRRTSSASPHAVGESAWRERPKLSLSKSMYRPAADRGVQFATAIRPPGRQTRTRREPRRPAASARPASIGTTRSPARSTTRVPAPPLRASGQIEPVDLLQQQRRGLRISAGSLQPVERLTFLDRRARKEEIGEQLRAHSPDSTSSSSSTGTSSPTSSASVRDWSGPSRSDAPVPITAAATRRPAC